MATEYGVKVNIGASTFPGLGQITGPMILVFDSDTPAITLNNDFNAFVLEGGGSIICLDGPFIKAEDNATQVQVILRTNVNLGGISGQVPEANNRPVVHIGANAGLILPMFNAAIIAKGSLSSEATSFIIPFLFTPDICGSAVTGVGGSSFPFRAADFPALLSGFSLILNGANSPRTYLDAAAPTVGDNASIGFANGDIWIDTTAEDAFILVNSAAGTWKQLTP